MRHTMTEPASRRIYPKSLSGASLEITRVLADRDGLTFRANGTCMYPTIRPGDVLQIQSSRTMDVQVGDIAVCRRPRYLFSHRVVAKGSEEGRAYIVTRPDRVPDKDDGPTFDENLLGIVVAMTRKGKPVPLRQETRFWPARRYFALCLALIESRLRVLLWWSGMLERLQQKAAYRRMAEAWLFLAHPRISYIVRVPMPALGDAVYRHMEPETFNVEKDWRGRPIQRWTLTMHLNGESRPAAWATLARGEADRWSVEECFVHARYRGAGLDKLLLDEADVILLRSPAKGQGDFEAENDGKPLRTSTISMH